MVPRPAQQWKHRLSHRDLTDDIHFELTAQLLERDKFQRTADRDPRVIDEAV
jgi:hypothetical protein